MHDLSFLDRAARVHVLLFLVADVEDAHQRAREVSRRTGDVIATTPTTPDGHHPRIRGDILVADAIRIRAGRCAHDGNLEAFRFGEPTEMIAFGTTQLSMVLRIWSWLDHRRGASAFGANA
jgi:hypothetical protein